MKLKDKVAIVTGATSGIGEASAKLFASEGVKVVVVGRNEERGNNVVNNIKDDGEEAFFVKVDMNNRDDMDELFEKTIDKYDKIDILFNNAGMAISGPLEDFKYKDFDNVIHTNLTAPFQMSKKAMPYLLKTKGTILNTASISGVVTHSNGYGYNPSKTALISLTKVLANDHAAQGVRVNAVAPGMTKTPILESVNDEQMEYLNNSIPIGRLAQPEDIANAALFLVSDDAAYITGEVLLVDGGVALVL